MTYPRKDDGPQRVVGRETKVELTRDGHKTTRTTIRVHVGPRKALRCR